VGTEERAEIYAQVQQRMKDLAPMVFLYQLDELYAVRDRLNWEPRADERIYLWNASLAD
jgi:peptide/nickel transport system substrate-binding protein